MKKCSHVVRDARLMYIHRDWFAYLWGANGEYIENIEQAREIVNRCYKMNPEHFKNYVLAKGYTLEELAQHIVGKRVFDCSSAVCALTQSEGDIMHIEVIADMNSYMLKNNFVTETGLVDGCWGSILWKEGHVGIDVGNGIAFDFACEFVDIREYRFIDDDTPTKFTVSGRLPWVDYSNPVYD